MQSKPKTDSHKTTPIQVTLAPFWKRLAAWVYDSLAALAVFILALLIGYLVIFIVTLPWMENGLAVSQAIYKNPLWTIYIVACVQYYYVWCWVKGGQTVGMKTWNIKVCKLDGSHLSWKEAYYRSFLSLGGLGNLWSLVDKEKRGWHDFICNSRVVVIPKHLNKQTSPLI